MPVTWDELARRGWLYVERLKSSPEARAQIFRGLRLCLDIEQVYLFNDGRSFVAWLRCEPEHLGAFLALDFAAITALGDELKTGRVLYVAEWIVEGQGLAYRFLDELCRETGVEWVAGWRRGAFQVRHADHWRGRRA